MRTILLHSLENHSLTKENLLAFAKGESVLGSLGYAEVFELYREFKYHFVEFYNPCIEDELKYDLDYCILDVVAISLKVLGLILQNCYEGLNDEDELFLNTSEAYYVFPNDNAILKFFEWHGFRVYQMDTNDKSYFLLYNSELGTFYRNHLEGDIVSLNAVKESIEELYEFLEDEFFEELDREETLKILKGKK